MSHQLFNVIFDGRVLEGLDPQAVEQRLSSQGLLSPEGIDAVRSGEPAVLVSGVAQDRALQYQSTLEVVGARTRVVPSQEEPSPEPVSPRSATVELPIEPTSEEASPELLFPDLGTPSLTSADLGTPDLGTPDLTSPDLGSPDLTAPDLGLPELGSPDLAAPVLAVPDDQPPATSPEAAGPRMTCPKCDFEQPEAAECGACGIVVSKFLQRQKGNDKTP
jgi:hypothetical protein